MHRKFGDPFLYPSARSRASAIKVCASSWVGAGTDCSTRQWTTLPPNPERYQDSARSQLRASAASVPRAFRNRAFPRLTIHREGNLLQRGIASLAHHRLDFVLARRKGLGLERGQIGNHGVLGAHAEGERRAAAGLASRESPASQMSARPWPCGSGCRIRNRETVFSSWGTVPERFGVTLPVS